MKKFDPSLTDAQKWHRMHNEWAREVEEELAKQQKLIESLDSQISAFKHLLEEIKKRAKH